MDYKNLMVGDWMYVVRGYDKHHTIEKIKGVIEDEDKPYPVTISTSETVSLNDINPIPLTEEILVKNGWFALDEYRYEGDVALAKESRGFRLKNTNICVNSVHQLQHLLRLCGIEKEIEL